MKKLKQIYEKHRKTLPLQVIIAVSFTMASVCCMGVLGVTLYQLLVNRMESMTAESSEQLLNQTAINMETYLRNMRRISDTMYYSVIKDKDLAVDTMAEEMNLLYASNKDNLISIACYTNDGELVEAVPVAMEREDQDIVHQQWFTEAVDGMENFHFSLPHVQHLFDNINYRYYWVVSLSRAVELTNNGSSRLGVLLVDMNYSSIEQFLEKANKDNSSEYVYLMDNTGEIIYHPKQKLIHMGLYKENNQQALSYEDGSCSEIFQKEERLITVKTVSYTGWKIVSVVPRRSFNVNLSETRVIFWMLVLLVVLLVTIINMFVSASIAKPLRKLNESVKEWEAGNMNPDIYVGSFLEVEHLGRTLRSTVNQVRQLMNDILVEQEEKRKSEFDALQSQINPHFLYNTLDSIIWMIEGERYDEAVSMISALASLFRISLSSGKTIICVEDEVRHAKNYMNIQKVRYKNIFSVDFRIDENILQCCTVKLVLQPLLENAIYYGVECMGGEGKIEVKGYRQGEDICLEVKDNGLGMQQELVEQILKEDNRIPKKGSGVGLINVHNRIRIRFGSLYGLKIESAPDEGTCIQIRLPYILYTPEMQEFLEAGHLKRQKGEQTDGQK